MGDKCEWKYLHDNEYETDCGGYFSFFDSGPENNEFKFCPYCGKELVEVDETEEES